MVISPTSVLNMIWAAQPQPAPTQWYLDLTYLFYIINSATGFGSDVPDPSLSWDQQISLARDNDWVHEWSYSDWQSSGHLPQHCGGEGCTSSHWSHLTSQGE